jgi:hypothetical protein
MVTGDRWMEAIHQSLITSHIPLHAARLWPRCRIALAPARRARTLAPATEQAHVAEWQTRTAQDRMGKPVEVRLLS